MPVHYGLYYPYMRFQSDDWLKVTALYWDRMGRIVPMDHEPVDSRTVSELGEIGYVQNLSPGYANDQLRDDLMSYLQSHGGELTRRYGLSTHQSGTPYPEFRSNVHRGPFRPDLMYILDEKIDGTVVEALLDLDLAQYGPRDSVGMLPTLGTAYMTSMANAMAPRIGATPVADTTITHLAASGLPFDRLADAMLDERAMPATMTQTEVEEYVLSVSFTSLMPSNLDDVSVSQLARFRERHADERGLFQQEMGTLVDRLVEEIPSVGDPDMLAQHVGIQIEKTIEPQFVALRKAMRGSGISTLDAVANVQFAVPPLVGSIAVAAGISLAAPIAIGVGATFGALGLWKSIRDSRIAAEKAAASTGLRYLVSIDSELKPIDLTMGMVGSARRLAHQ